MIQTTEQFAHAAKTAEWLNEAALATADYSSKAAARQLAFARKVAERSGDFSWDKLFSAPADAAEVKRTADEYLAFARESVEDFAQASARHFALWERAVEDAAADGQALLPSPARVFGRQWFDGVKAAGAAAKDGVSVSCRVAADGLRPAEAVAANGKAGGKTGKK